MNDMRMIKEIGTNIKAMMKNRGMTQRELAKYSGVSLGTINYYINGERMPSVKNIINICIALECSTEIILPTYEYIR